MISFASDEDLFSHPHCRDRREEPLEIHGVLEGSWGAWAIEVKTGRISTSDLKGLGEFVHRHARFRPLVVCDDDARPVAERAGVEVITWIDFLLRGPPGSAAAR